MRFLGYVNRQKRLKRKYQWLQVALFRLVVSQQKMHRAGTIGFNENVQRQRVASAFVTEMFSVVCLEPDRKMIFSQRSVGGTRRYIYDRSVPVGFVNDWFILFAKEPLTSTGRHEILGMDLRQMQGRMLRLLYRTRKPFVGIQYVPGLGTLVLSKDRIRLIQFVSGTDEIIVSRVSGAPTDIVSPFAYLPTEGGLALQRRNRLQGSNAPGIWREYEVRQRSIAPREPTTSLQWVKEWLRIPGINSPFLGYKWTGSVLNQRLPNSSRVQAERALTETPDWAGFDYQEKLAFTVRIGQFRDREGVLFKFWDLTEVVDELGEVIQCVSDCDIDDFDVRGSSDEDE